MKLSTDRVTITIENQIALVKLNRPEKHNGVDIPMVHTIVEAGEKLARNKDVRAVILSGEGPSFCAGLDVAAVMGNKTKAALAAAELYKPWTNVFQRWGTVWRDLPVPVIAAIHGNCFGAGMQLALAADIRFSRADAKLSIMEAKWGLVPDMSGALTLRELLPIDVAKELTMTGRVISGEQALALGLVTHTSEDPVAAAITLAEEIVNRSPDSVANTKALFHEAWLSDDSDALAAERKFQRQIIGKKNMRIAAKRNFQLGKGKGGDDLEPYVRRR